ncbi:hypothetical protein KP509_06G035700 [Ceratopteris richardii]|uniref:Uncharacterized protein n=1 Tax=Ceratopteris richardii TaxID=49495 RepID=A0A8T2UH43_CERRI|nr:hypothetical protein KP509_06G035700 [Ceratopteris richardii]
MASSAPVSRSDVEMVHHLIERCLLMIMTLEESMDALAKHAQIDPIFTKTERESSSFNQMKRKFWVAVWTELEKANKEFFSAYNSSQKKRVFHPSQKKSF